jgi:hypothetical protein
LEICNGVQHISVDVSGFIKSPGYPGFYGNRRNCTITLEADGLLTSFVEINLLMMNLEKVIKSRPVDYLLINDQIYNGTINESISIKIKDPKRFNLSFVTDAYVLTELEGPIGFLIQYKG